MPYIATDTQTILTDNDLAKRGLSSPEAMRLAGIFPIEEIYPDYDPRLETIVPGSVELKGGKYIRDWSAKPLPLYLLKIARKEDATAIRWERETGGITLPGGTRVLTGIDDQNRISTAIQGMRDNGMTEVDFKAASGWVKLSLDEMLAIAGAIAAHVQGCFSNERRLHEAIDAAQSPGELNAIDLGAGWPVGNSGACLDGGE